MAKNSKYISKTPDRNGLVHWTEPEHAMWSNLFENQQKHLSKHACPEFTNGLNQLNLPSNRIPQLPEVDKVMRQTTGWSTKAVKSLIGFEEFFSLLASKKFPVATFIRCKDDTFYLQEPDIFHEIFGHCPMLTNGHFAEYTERYGKMGLKATPKERQYLARLYWFTVEFGLLKTANETKIYGGGILSSIEETHYALESDTPQIKPLNLLETLRTPYRIDILQPIYYYIESLSCLTEFSEKEILAALAKAIELGLFEPTFPPKTA
jgi:phenylalanine-4-hydroxylase